MDLRKLADDAVPGDGVERGAVIADSAPPTGAAILPVGAPELACLRAAWVRQAYRSEPASPGHAAILSADQDSGPGFRLSPESRRQHSPQRVSSKIRRHRQ